MSPMIGKRFGKYSTRSRSFWKKVCCRNSYQYGRFLREYAQITITVRFPFDGSPDYTHDEEYSEIVNIVDVIL